MILIFSNSGDPSTLDVMRWIDHLSDAKVVRINADEEYSVELTISDDDFSVRVDEDAFGLEDVTSVWLRKGGFWFKGLFPSVAAPEHPALARHLQHKLDLENRTLRDHFHDLLRRRSAVLGSANGSAPNKLVVLGRAREVGLRTPPYSVSNLRSHAQSLVASGCGYVTKAMSDGLYLFDTTESRTGYFTYTEALEPRVLEGVGERMAPSLFQRYVDKAFELRVFFLDDQFRAAAIFSQSDAQTRVDYRKYNSERPNRVVPFRLPPEIEAKLSLLARSLDLNTGSFDMIVDAHGEYYLLEVNPVGQFGPLSERCNMAIERMIAERLVAREQRV
ncbi:grasp-with-spasm system ATP-grasp peptide maturase [Nannocystis bainbridge]|uniref:Grasp-with-spasm system ATP-grasp peptide maturase n=1 Tax=Nannocystis bainbridge TaxID=2995303 RepID=A0ABT5DQE5_9BACT|nr:grasp-with-spasm system ATP-grasp peptide maturase [Nannocystis bainbridge]MDC0715819.1 grasp-with-spasm system ATP-grasp peptide maturase [Nannocystis bainbridge]